MAEDKGAQPSEQRGLVTDVVVPLAQSGIGGAVGGAVGAVVTVKLGGGGQQPPAPPAEGGE